MPSIITPDTPGSVGPYPGSSGSPTETSAKQRVDEATQKVSQLARHLAKHGTDAELAAAGCKNVWKFLEKPVRQLQDKRLRNTYAHQAFFGILVGEGHTIDDGTLLEAVVDVMRLHPQEQEVQGHGLTVLCHASVHPDSEQTLCGLGAVDIALDAIRDHPQDAGIQCNALGLLQNLAQSDSLASSIALGGIEATINTMRTHLSHTLLLVAGMGLLVNLVEGSPDRAKVVMMMGGLQLVDLTMRTHGFNEGLKADAEALLEAMVIADK